MTFVKHTENELKDLFVTIDDIKVLSGTFLRGTILKRIGSSGMRGDDFVDCDGNKLLETALCADQIVPLSEAYKLFKPKTRA